MLPLVLRWKDILKLRREQEKEDRQAKQPDGSGSRRRQAHQHLDRGRLAGSVGAKESEKTRARDAQSKPVYSGFLVVHLPEIVNLNRRSRIPRNVGHASSLW